MAAPAPTISISSSSADSSSHRLPTQSASAALQQLQDSSASALSSGLSSLDCVISGGAPSPQAGFERGKVAEIWGPAGAGKTTIALQAAKEAIKNGVAATWISCSTLLAGSRLKHITHELSSGTDQTQGGQKFFHHLAASSLSHLLALVVHPSASFPTKETNVLVIDDLNSLIDLDYPRFSSNFRDGTEPQKWQAKRRYAILGTLATALTKLAVLRNIAIIVTTGCSSRMRADEGLPAALGPGIGGSEWDSGIWTRIVAFQDFRGRFLGAQKCRGRNLMPLDPVGDVRNVVGFEITAAGGLREQIVDLRSSDSGSSVVQLARVAPSPAKAVRKRAYEEIADSEDEDIDEYGWAEADDVETDGNTLVAVAPEATTSNP